MDFISAKNTREYVLSHGILLPNNQVFLTKPLKGFKKINTYRENMDSRISNILSEVSYQELLVSTINAFIEMNSPIEQSRAIAELVIPVHSIVNIGRELYTNVGIHTSENDSENDFYKLRSDTSICLLIERISDNVKTYFGSSIFTNSYLYISVKKFLNNCSGPVHIINHSTDRINKGILGGYIRDLLNYPQKGFCKKNEECAGGIHFFLNKETALLYNDF